MLQREGCLQCKRNLLDLISGASFPFFYWATGRKLETYFIILWRMLYIFVPLLPSLVNMPNLISVHCRLFRNQTEPIVATKLPPLFVHRHQIHSRDYYRPPPTILPGKTSSITLRRTRVHDEKNRPGFICHPTRFVFYLGLS